MHIAQNWRLKAQRYALQGVKCEVCETVMFPPREVCPHCREAELKARLMTMKVVETEPVAELNAAR
jgi:uncharacterized OB-fold protein